MIHATEILSNFIAELKYEDLPPIVVETVKRFILDYYAACFAGIKVNAKFNKAMEELVFEVGGREEASVLCYQNKLPSNSAAFMNAIYAHGADLDDGNRKAMGHVSAHVMSVVFALAERMNVSGKDIITAIVAGYEVYNRTAAAVQPGLVHRGFHSTGTAGALACGAAAAKLMGLDEAGIYNAVSLAAVQSSGLMLIVESGQSCKPINPANAARSGILAAQLAEKGVTGPVYPLESSKGWFHAMSDVVDETQVTEGLGRTFTICESYLKPYPSCRHTHCGIEAALKIRKKIVRDFGKLDVEKVEHVILHVYPNAIRVAGSIQIPKTDEEAKFSIHYALAIALWRGHFVPSDLSVERIESEIYEIVQRIKIVSDDSMENTKAGIRGARMQLEYTGNASYEEYIGIPKGDAANPFTMGDLQEKLAVCADGVITEAQQQHLICAVNNFDVIENYVSINALLENAAKE